VSPLRIIGVGSPFGQDRYGWQAVEALRNSDLLQHYPDGLVSLHRCDSPGMDLLNMMHGADGVIIIDALQSGSVPGTLQCLDAQDLSEECERFSSHGFGVAATLELGRALGDLPQHVRIVAIEMDPACASGRPLSSALIEDMLTIINREINQISNKSDLISRLTTLSG